MTTKHGTPRKCRCVAVLKRIRDIESKCGFKWAGSANAASFLTEIIRLLNNRPSKRRARR